MSEHEDLVAWVTAKLARDREAVDMRMLNMGILWLTPLPASDLVNRYFDLLWLHEIGIKP